MSDAVNNAVNRIVKVSDEYHKLKNRRVVAVAIKEVRKNTKKRTQMDLKSKFDKITPFVSNPFHFVTDKLINNKLIGKNKYLRATLKTLRGYESRDMLQILNESVSLIPSSVPGVEKAKYLIPKLASAYSLFSRISSNIESYENEDEEQDYVYEFLHKKEEEFLQNSDGENFTSNEVDEHFTFPKAIMEWFTSNGFYGETIKILSIWNAKTEKQIQPSDISKQTDRLLIECYWDIEFLKRTELGQYVENHIFSNRFYIEMRPQSTWKLDVGYTQDTKYKAEQFWNLDGSYITQAWTQCVLTAMRSEYLRTLDLNNNIIRITRFGNFELQPRIQDVTYVYDNIEEWGGTDKFVHKVNAALSAGKRYGAMLVGNPGTGKTSVINQIQSKISEYPIVYVSPDDIAYLSSTLEQLLPCVAVFEDIEAFEIQSKGSRNTQAMLQILDGSRYPGLVCIASVNDTSLLTPAIVRTGRFDDIIEVHEPRTRKSMYQIIKFYVESDEGYEAKSISKLLPWTLYFKLRYITKVTCSDLVGMVDSCKLEEGIVSAKTLTRAYQKHVLSRKTVELYAMNEDHGSKHQRKKFLGIF